MSNGAFVNGAFTNSIAEAPDDLFETSAAKASPAINSLQSQFVNSLGPSLATSSRDSSVTGAVLGEMDDTTAEALVRTDRAVANAMGSSDTMPVVSASASDSKRNLAQSNLVERIGSQTFLTIPPTSDIYNTPAANAAFDRLFTPSKNANPNF